MHLRHLCSTIASKLVFRTWVFDTGHQGRADLVLAVSVPCPACSVVPSMWLAMTFKECGPMQSWSVLSTLDSLYSVHPGRQILLWNGFIIPSTHPQPHICIQGGSLKVRALRIRQRMVEAEWRQLNGGMRHDLRACS